MKTVYINQAGIIKESWNYHLENWLNLSKREWKSRQKAGTFPFHTLTGKVSTVWMDRLPQKIGGKEKSKTAEWKRPAATSAAEERKRPAAVAFGLAAAIAFAAQVHESTAAHKETNWCAARQQSDWAGQQPCSQCKGPSLFTFTNRRPSLYLSVLPHTKRPQQSDRGGQDKKTFPSSWRLLIFSLHGNLKIKRTCFKIPHWLSFVNDVIFNQSELRKVFQAAILLSCWPLLDDRFAT